jgi:hypothetical protein
MASLVLAGTSANAAVVDNLVEYWALDGNYSAEVTPAHVGTQVTTGSGSGTFAPGKFGQAIDLESSSGNQAYITIGGAESDFDFAGGDMSVSMWYDAENLYTSWQALVAKGEGGAWRLARASGSNNLIKYDVIGPTVDGKLNVAGWHHVVATVDDPVGVTIYVDGVPAGSYVGDPNIGNAPTAMQIGGNPQAGGRAWDGLIDDVAVWDRALTADEVSLIWNDGDGASIGSFFAPEIIPEPSTFLVWSLLAGLGLFCYRRRR